MQKAEKRWLRYDFTASEVHELSMSLAQTTQEAARIADEKKSVNSSYKSKIDSAAATISNLSNKVANGYEIREVDCNVKYHFPEHNQKTITRSDSGQKIIEKMTPEDYNLFTQEGVDVGDDDEINY